MNTRININVNVIIDKQDAAPLFNMVYNLGNNLSDDDLKLHGEDFEKALQILVNRAVNEGIRGHQQASNFQPNKEF